MEQPRDGRIERITLLVLVISENSRLSTAISDLSRSKFRIEKTRVESDAKSSLAKYSVYPGHRQSESSLFYTYITFIQLLFTDAKITEKYGVIRVTDK